MIKIAVNAGENDGISIVDRKKDIEKLIGDEIVVEEPPISLFHEQKRLLMMCVHMHLYGHRILHRKNIFLI